MSGWQIGISIIGAIYAAGLLAVVVTSVRAWRAVPEEHTQSPYCPAGSGCRLCSEARERDARQPAQA